MNVIIIDNSKRSMQIMRRFLAKGIPDVAVTEYDPDQRGTPPHAFDWAEYDTLLLSQDLGAAGTGLQWLEDYGSSANFPPTIIVAQKDDPQVTSNALKLGAHSVITKRDLTPDNLGRLVQEASVAEPVKREGAGDRKDNSADAEIVAQAQGPEGEGYKITRLIGQGAMSRVYLADRLADKQTVVLKIMDGTLTNDNEVVKRFILEATLVSGLESSHVVKVYDQGFTDKYGYMAMEFFPVAISSSVSSLASLSSTRSTTCCTSAMGSKQSTTSALFTATSNRLTSCSGVTITSPSPTSVSPSGWTRPQS